MSILCSLGWHNRQRRWDNRFDALCSYNTANNNAGQSWGQPAPKWSPEYIAAMAELQAQYNASNCGSVFKCVRCGAE